MESHSCFSSQVQWSLSIIRRISCNSSSEKRSRNGLHSNDFKGQVDNSLEKYSLRHSSSLLRAFLFIKSLGVGAAIILVFSHLAPKYNILKNDKGVEPFRLSLRRRSYLFRNKRPILHTRLIWSSVAQSAQQHDQCRAEWFNRCPLVKENCHVFVIGQRENTFANMYAFPKEGKGKYNNNNWRTQLCSLWL